MVAGVRHWREGRFDLFRVNPPLARIIATLPVVLSDPATDWNDFRDIVVGRPEFKAGSDFIRLNGVRSFWLFTIGRWACIPISVIGVLVCYRWARDLYGKNSGIIAATLWCLSPNITAHAQLITSEASAAAFGCLAGYCFWRWLKNATLWATLSAGVVLGLAELSKTTWIVLIALWLAVWLVWRCMPPRQVARQTWVREAGSFIVIQITGLYVLNLGYVFEGTFSRLGDLKFVSRTLAGTESRIRLTKGANRFQGSFWQSFRIPLPESYILGIDIQKRDFEVQPYSYLAGRWRAPGWWYYYLYALAVKVPLGTWCLVALAVGVTPLGSRRKGTVPFSPGERCDSPQPVTWRDEMVVLAPGLVILIFVSSQTGFSIHSRYVVPTLPFLFIWTSKIGRVIQPPPLIRKRFAIAAIAVVALSCSITSSLWTYPHSLSYFNELVGGPRRGGEHLLNSNIDWGQDLLYLKSWLNEHPDVTLNGLAYWGSCPPTLSGIPVTPNPSPGPGADNHNANRSVDNDVGPKPGWYALSVNEIYGRSRQYRYFLEFDPIATAGYSIYIYQVTLDEANRARRNLGLPELPAEGGEKAAGNDASSSEVGFLEPGTWLRFAWVGLSDERVGDKV